MADPILQFKTLTDGTDHYTFRTNLEGIDYQIRLDWSTRESRWYMSLYSATEELLCGQIKVLTNWPMLRYYHHREGMPTGEIIAASLQTDDDSPPGLYELGVGKRCTLSYFVQGSLT
jgi:hypothetical protein